MTTDIAYVQDAMLAFASHAESCGVSCSAQGARAIDPPLPGADALGSFEVSKPFDQAFLPIGRVVVGFLSGKVASASFEPAAPLALGLFGGDRTDDVYPLASEQMLALREAFSPWPRDEAVVAVDLAGALSSKLNSKRANPATGEPAPSSPRPAR